MARHIPAQAATDLLLRQRLCSLRFDITRLRFDRNIVFDTIQHFCRITPVDLRELHTDGGDGLTIVRRTRELSYYVVLWNEDVINPRRRRFTLAHEIGHICLGHLDDGAREEPEADAFAAQLLMPRILVEQLAESWSMPLTPDILCDVFGVSRGAAALCLQSLREPAVYTDNDYALLQRYAALLPHPSEPVVTV